MATALYTHDDCVLHEISPGHPEQPARIQAVSDQLKADNVYQTLSVTEAPLAELDHLARAHGAKYVDLSLIHI